MIKPGSSDLAFQGTRLFMGNFYGVRIFDISDIRSPKQVAAVQTCRGSHTHALVVDPKDKKNVYIYVSGTSFVLRSEELPGCSADRAGRGGDTRSSLEVSRGKID